MLAGCPKLGWLLPSPKDYLLVLLCSRSLSAISTLVVSATLRSLVACLEPIVPLFAIMQNAASIRGTKSPEMLKMRFLLSQRIFTRRPNEYMSLYKNRKESVLLLIHCLPSSEAMHLYKPLPHDLEVPGAPAGG